MPSKRSDFWSKTRIDALRDAATLTNFDPLAYSTNTLQPLARRLCDLTDRPQTAEQFGYFSLVLRQLEEATDPGHLAETFVNRSTSAFMGFDYRAEVAFVLDDLLEDAEIVAETLSIDSRERH